jgi:tRNA (guanine-N7-)-methyltransferase
MIMPLSSPQEKRIRSFVRRSGRVTAAQSDAIASLWSRYGIEMGAGKLDFPQLFQRVAPCILEIGFGAGQSLLAAAQKSPETDFIGVDIHRPGIGTLLQGIELHQLTNIRIYNQDVMDVLEQCIPPDSLAGVQIFFPDPWPKRRHHKRRLIQPEFVTLLLMRLQLGGILHLATDWQDYARHMMKVLSQEKNLINLAGESVFADRSPQRPIVTKFEARSQREGRKVWELQFVKK